MKYLDHLKQRWITLLQKLIFLNDRKISLKWTDFRLRNCYQLPIVMEQLILKCSRILQQTFCISHIFWGSRIQEWFSRCFLFVSTQVSHEAVGKLLDRAAVIWRLAWGEWMAHSHGCGLWRGHLNSLLDFGRRTQFLSLAFPQGYSGWGSWHPQSKQSKRRSKQDTAVTFMTQSPQATAGTVLSSAP